MASSNLQISEWSTAPQLGLCRQEAPGPLRLIEIPAGTGHTLRQQRSAVLVQWQFVRQSQLQDLAWEFTEGKTPRLWGCELGTAWNKWSKHVQIHGQMWLCYMRHQLPAVNVIVISGDLWIYVGFVRARMLGSMYVGKRRTTISAPRCVPRLGSPQEKTNGSR